MDPPRHHHYPFYPDRRLSPPLYHNDHPPPPSFSHSDLYHHHHQHLPQYNPIPPPPLPTPPPPPSSTHFFPPYPQHRPLPPPPPTFFNDTHLWEPSPRYEGRFSDPFFGSDRRFSDPFLGADRRFADPLLEPERRFSDPFLETGSRFSDPLLEPERRFSDPFLETGSRFSDPLMEPERRFSDSSLQEIDRHPVSVSPRDDPDEDRLFRRRVKDRIVRPPVRERLGHAAEVYHHRSPIRKKKGGFPPGYFPPSFIGKKFVPAGERNFDRPLTSGKVSFVNKLESVVVDLEGVGVSSSRECEEKNPRVYPNGLKSVVVRSVVEDEVKEVFESCPDGKGSTLPHSKIGSDVNRYDSLANCSNSGEMELEPGEFVIPTVMEEDAKNFHESKGDSDRSSTEIVDILSVDDDDEVLSNGCVQSADLELQAGSFIGAQCPDSLLEDKDDSMMLPGMGKDGEAEMMLQPSTHDKDSHLVQSSVKELSVSTFGSLMTFDASKDDFSENCSSDGLFTESGECVSGSVVIEENSSFRTTKLPLPSSDEQDIDGFADGIAGTKHRDSLVTVSDVRISNAFVTTAKDLDAMKPNTCCSDENDGIESESKVNFMADSLQILADPSPDADAAHAIPDSDDGFSLEAGPKHGISDPMVFPPLPPSNKPTVTHASSKISLSQGTKSVSSPVKFPFGTPKQLPVPSNGVKRAFPFVTPKQVPGPSNGGKRARTWHREGNNSSSSTLARANHSFSSSMHNEPSSRHQIQAASYIRKGNSLVRKPSITKDLNGAGSSLKTIYGEEKNKALDFVESIPLLERPKTPPLNSKFQRLDCRPSVVSNNQAVITGGLPKCLTSDLLTEADGPGEDDEKVKTNVKKHEVVYVKRRPNQLVAAPTSEVAGSANVESHELPAVHSNRYFKNKKNQIIREVETLKSCDKMEDNSGVAGSRETQMLPILKHSRNFGKKVLNRASRHPSKYSLVWNLRKESSDGKIMTNAAVRYQFLPHLMPWKRSSYRRNSSINRVVSLDKSSLFRKLQHSRKRSTCYTKSKNGFSMWKSRVLSIGGSNLKWSKSIERRSKKASEEATLAVVAASQKKERKITSVAGEQIYRVGSFRYKMDSSKETLMRISDDESSGRAGPGSGIGIKKSFIPSRLVIGNNEYVRVGNGNKLVRDQKRFKRIFANEKIKWSLHHARLRQAKKQQYCQFFTRFGKCNKENGKCPYIHDPDKIAVCTKFLNDSCSGTNCKLTHKILPERMPDCSYFLQGLCIIRDCPYRHVNVNKDACVCEGFLRGYCADGDKCRKRHTYVCPAFESDGICLKGTACKLHHPKNLNRGRKRERRKEQKRKGRYFDSSKLLNGCELGAALTGEDKSMEVENKFSEGAFLGADYISLAPYGEEETTDSKYSRIYSFDCEESDELSDGFDKLIKPFRILNKI